MPRGYPGVASVTGGSVRGSTTCALPSIVCARVLLVRDAAEGPAGQRGALSGPWDCRRGGDPGSGLGSRHTCPSSQVSGERWLFSPQPSRVRDGRALAGSSARLLRSRRQSTPAKPVEVQGCPIGAGGLGHRGARVWGRSPQPAVPWEVWYGHTPSFCMAFKELVLCCP